MKKIVLVSCVSVKKEGIHKAKDLYDSPWFKKARACVELIGNPWYIISAKYHLLDPEKEIEKYDLTLKTMKKTDRQEWAKIVLKDLLPMLEPGDEIIFLAGDAYREFLMEPLTQAGVKFRIPMEGLGIGRQLEWFDNKYAVLTGAEPRKKSRKAPEEELKDLKKKRDSAKEKIISKNKEYEEELNSIKEKLLSFDLAMKGKETLKDILQYEFNSLECHISAHPLDDPLIKFMKKYLHKLEELDEIIEAKYPDRQPILFACVFKSGKETIAKRSGKPMFTMTFEGRISNTLARKFGDRIPEYKSKLKEGEVYIIKGTWSNKYGVDIEALKPLNNFFRTTFAQMADQRGIDISSMLI
jgi:hypothetical protein